MSRRPKPRISDVARRAKVSVGTVSHVLTGSAKVSAARRARVERAIEEMGYVPNFHAQGLRSSLTRIVGICFPHSSTAYLNELSETLEEIASRDGYGVMHVFSRHDPATELDRVKELIRYRVDGLVLIPSATPGKALDFAHRKGVPLVVIDRPTQDARFDHVTLDNRKTMREVAQHLVDLGHRRLLLICRSRSRLVTQHRIRGLDAVKRASHGKVDVQVIEFQNDERFLFDELARVLRDRSAPTAIVVSNSHQAALLLGFLRDLDIRCPDDVSVVSFDDSEWSRLVTPRLSVVRQPAMAMATAAWDLLMQRVNGIDGPSQTVALEAAIDLRESVAPPFAKRGGEPRRDGAPEALSDARTAPVRRSAGARAGSRRPQPR
jgi:LacI family transcriptional regulator